MLLFLQVIYLIFLITENAIFCRMKTVTVSLWSDHATNIGQELMEKVDTAPIVALKCLKVGDFQGT